MPQPSSLVLSAVSPGARRWLWLLGLLGRREEDRYDRCSTGATHRRVLRHTTPTAATALIVTCHVDCNAYRTRALHFTHFIEAADE